MSLWISKTVLDGESNKERGAIIEFWIDVSKHLNVLNNFNALVEVLGKNNFYFFIFLFFYLNFFS